MADKKSKVVAKSDDFQSVARRLECGTDMDKFDAKLKKIAQTKASPKRRA
jgi:hypothetical protein